MNRTEIDAVLSSLTEQQGAQDELKHALADVQQNPSDPNALLRMQQILQQWQMVHEKQTQMIEQFNESLKDIITKIG